MKPNPLIYFHLGLQKAASTLLQQNVFPYFENIRFVKKHDFKNYKQIISNNSHQNYLLSIELELNRYVDGLDKIYDVAKSFPGSKPIIILREHSSWLSSRYKYYLRKHGTVSFEEFYQPGSDKTIVTDEHLNFYEKLQLIEKIYQQRPLVLFMNELINDPFGFIDIIADYTGATYDKNKIRMKYVHKAFTIKQLYFLRRHNRRFRYSEKGITKQYHKFVYRKWHDLILHSLAFFSKFLPVKPEKYINFISDDILNYVERTYNNDWIKCIEYVKQDRKLLF